MCTSTLGFSHQSWLCQSGHSVKRQNGDCSGQEAWRDSGDLFLQLESPGVLVVSVLVNALWLSSEAWGFLLFRFVLTPCDFLVQETLCFN